MYKNLITEAELKNTGLLDNNVSSSYIAPILKYVQDESLTRLLGKDFYINLMEKKTDNNLNAHEITLIDFYIKDILKWGILAEIQIPLNSKFRNMGMVETTDDNVNSNQIAELKYTKNQYAMKQNFYSNRMTDFLVENRKHYPLYKCKPSSFNTQIYLG